MQSQDKIPDRALKEMGVNMNILQRERDIVDAIHVLEEDPNLNWPRIKLLTEELIELQRQQPKVGPKFS